MYRKKRLVVIGGVAAGLSAASYVKRRRPDIEVLVLEKSPHASYGSCGLPYLIEGLVEDPMELIARPIEELREKRGLDVRVLHEVLTQILSGDTTSIARRTTFATSSGLSIIRVLTLIVPIPRSLSPG